MCTKKGNTLHLKDWLFHCTNQCKICKKIGCSYCMMTCYECHNNGENFDFLCDDCSEGILTESKCEEHDEWFVCKDHINSECSMCTYDSNCAAKAKDGAWH